MTPTTMVIATTNIRVNSCMPSAVKAYPSALAHVSYGGGTLLVGREPDRDDPTLGAFSVKASGLCGVF